jgi:hypothetical protein
MRACNAEDCEFCDPPRPRPEDGRIVVDRGANDMVVKSATVSLSTSSITHEPRLDSLKSRSRMLARREACVPHFRGGVKSSGIYSGVATIGKSDVYANTANFGFCDSTNAYQAANR